MYNNLKKYILTIENLFFSEDINFKILVEQLSGGMGNKVNSIISKIKEFEEENPDARAADYIGLMVNLGFEPMSSGTQRIVYDIDGDHVLKLSKNDSSGLNSNKQESRMSNQNILKDLIPKVYESSDNGYWIIMDKVLTYNDLGLSEPQAMEKWITDLGIVDEHLEFLRTFLNHYINNKDFDKALNLTFNDFDITEVDEQIEILNNPFMSNLLRAIRTQSIGGRIFQDIYERNIGWTTEGRPIILDWGGS